MTEPININVDRPQVYFAVDGQTLASFDYFELEEAIDTCGTKNNDEDIRQWMIAHGLPENISVYVVRSWLTAYISHLNNQTKKDSGQ